MRRTTRNVTRGAGRELKGSVKEAAGRVAGKPGLRIKGRLEKAAGRAQRKLGETERDLEKAERDRDYDTAE